MTPKNVERAIKDLIALGAVTTDKPLGTARGWFSRALDWKEQRPVITIAPELRALERPPISLGAWGKNFAWITTAQPTDVERTSMELAMYEVWQRRGDSARGEDRAV